MCIEIKSQSLTDALIRESDWILSLLTPPQIEGAGDRVKLLVIGCVDILSQSITDYSAWKQNKNRGNLIRKAHLYYTNRNHNQAIRELIALTVSDLEANRPFKPRVFISQVLSDVIRGGPPKTKACERCGTRFLFYRKTAQFCCEACRKQQDRQPRLSA